MFTAGTVNRTRRILARTLLFAASFLVAGAEAQETIKIGYFMQIHDIPYMVIEKELGSKYKLEFVRFLRYSDAEVALTRGDIQLSSLGYSNVVTASLREAQPGFMMVTGLARGAVSIVCRTDVKVEGWNDLKGKKFGVLTGGTAELFFDDGLRSNGVKRSDISTVSFTVIGPPLLQAMKNKDIDCMAVFEPFAAVSVVDGFGYYPSTNLAENSFLGINNALAVNANFLKKNPDFVKDAVKAAVAATAFYNNERTKMMTDFPRLEFKPEVIKIGADRVILDTKLYLRRTVMVAEAMKNLGFIREMPAKEKIEAYFNYDFLIAATGKSADEMGRDK
jgi:ABC-type nitrate/sulfonate/bicarbonate transport system substrate-binding protein